MAKTFPGARRNISNTRKWFLAKITDEALKGVKDPREQFNYLIVPAMRALGDHEEMQEWMDKGGWWKNKYVAELIKTMKPATLDLLKTCTTTKETLVIAEEVHAIIMGKVAPLPLRSRPKRKRKRRRTRASASRRTSPRRRLAKAKVMASAITRSRKRRKRTRSPPTTARVRRKMKTIRAKATTKTRPPKRRQMSPTLAMTTAMKMLSPKKSPAMTRTILLPMRLVTKTLTMMTMSLRPAHQMMKVTMSRRLPDRQRPRKMTVTTMNRQVLVLVTPVGPTKTRMAKALKDSMKMHRAARRSLRPALTVVE
ncbi:hypothetical protein U8P73_36775 (plasmid) [Rhizobium beringeri]|uniref:hypothetical protein n=1 Tax=Rhizobium beringeri TaxID=3019934 RepID=UPI002DDCCED9|nr:hypothetical protein [Rhizobium beringeri]WSG93528.1 hypothetical protein U8P73_36775 [Rhizobium beringeri]